MWVSVRHNNPSKPGTALHDIIMGFCQETGFHPRISFETSDERTIAGLVGAKFGVALIPFFSGLDMQKISLIHVRKPKCLMTIQMVWQTNGYMSPAAACFKSYVENTLNLNE